MAYDYDESFTNSVTEYLTTATRRLEMVQGIQPISTTGIMPIEYVNIDDTERPSTLAQEIADAKQYIDGLWKDLKDKPIFNLSWPTDETYSEITNSLDSIVYDPIDSTTNRALERVWERTPTVIALEKRMSDAMATGELAAWDNWQEDQYQLDDANTIQELRDAMDKGRSATAGKGFNRPTSKTFHILSLLSQKYQLERESKNRDIIKLVLSHVSETMMTATTQGLVLEEVYMRFTEGYNTFFAKAKQQAVAVFRDRVKAEILKHQGLVKAARQKADWMLSAMAGDLAKMSSILEITKADELYYSASNEKLRIYLDAYSALAKTHNDRLALLHLQIEDRKAQVESNLAEIKLNLYAYTQSMAVSLKGVSNIQSAAMHSMNAGRASTIDLARAKRTA